MAKKKKKAPVEETILELTPRQIEDAKAAILEVGADVSYAKAKSLLIKKLGVARSVANAIIVALHQSGFGGESKNWFEHPDAQCVNGVVRGARQLERMSVMSQDDPSVELELNGEASYLPGDVVELRRAEHGWRIGRFISRGQKRWVCRITYSGSRSISVTPVSAFAPFELSVPREEIPPEVDLKRDAIEVELDETELSPRKMPFNWEGPDWNALEAHFVRRVGRTDDPLGEMAIASAENFPPRRSTKRSHCPTRSTAGVLRIASI